MERIGFLIAILLVSTFTIVDGQGNTLHAGETLQHNELLNSSNGKFQLGFFNITSTKNQYIRIWYTDPNKTKVWVANGDHPIISSSGTLTLSQDGTLFLRDSAGQEMWSTGSHHSIGEPQACLLDSGVLVVNDTKTGKLLWQSLYQLSDTLLPYVPLGYTKLLDSILEIQLTSWNTTGTDPSPGQYIRKLDPSRQYELVTFKGSEVFYRSGPWNGTGWNGFHIMTQEMVRFFVSKSGSNGAFFWYEPLDPSLLWQQVLKDDGITYRNYFNGSDWNGYWKAPLDSTAPYAKCGPYGIFIDDNCKCCIEGLFHPKNEVDWMNRKFTGGCERSAPKNDPNDGFVTLRNLKLPDTINAISDERKSKSECATWCQKNLSCTAYAYIGWQGCLVWFGDIIDMQQLPDGGDNLYVRVGSKEHNKLKIILIALGIGIAAIVILLIVVILVRKKTIFNGNFCSLRWPSSRTQRVVGNIPSTGREGVQIFECFDFKTIKAATGDFSDTTIIGTGQLGPVYKGVLENGEEIAVKRLSRSAHNGDEQLKNELNLLARLKHKNLVKLTGFCIQQEETILCFEFMQNRSLDQVLFGSGQIDETSKLSWEQRFKLIQGISSGLLYLHEDNGDTIIHRDVKPGNILLDRNMIPKISDFGLARLFIEQHSFLITSTIGGTRGYIAPEVQSGMLSTKVDVYSLGMVILEIISGKRNSSSPLGLVSIALQYLNERRILEFKDARLRESYSQEEIKRCMHIALLCLLEEPQKRPNMRLINLWLASQSIPITALPAQAEQWGNIAIDSSTVVDSSDLL